MKLRPTIFLSGVSSEFASFRDAVEIEIQKKDCFPLNQPSFGVDYRTIEEILRRNISEADAVIHIVGFRFGFEPRDRPPDKPRRSYTQMEYDIARELNKPVYVFLSADATVRDPNPGEQSEDAEAVQLQLEHRRTLEQLNNIRYSMRDKSELCRLVAAIPLLATADFRVDIGRIDRYAPAELVGREDELKLLDGAWLKVRRGEPKRPHILTFVALGGEGKTSLVAKWAATLAHKNWPGCDSAFAWSFYSQGSHEQSAASSDLFLKEAISFLGNDSDKEFATSNAAAYEKGQRLADIISQRRALLILDGLEPLQYAPTSPTSGELKDSGIAALLRGLAAESDGLCIVTSRYSLPNLKAYWQATAPEIRLTRLSLEAGVHLLGTLGVKGSLSELEKLIEDVKGHALTLNLLGTYLRDAYGGDIRRRDLIKLEEANAEEQGGHAFRVMEAYEEAFEKEGDKGKRALAVLRLLGLFDRPGSADCFAALLDEPHINGLTEPFIGLSEAQLNLALKRLEDAKLITINREASGALFSLDAHPLLREYFARQLFTQEPDAWRAGHRRLYEHLCISTPDKPQPTLEDLQPLYQAVAHGCKAGFQKEACEKVYLARILRGSEHYSWHRLGAYGSELAALANFFETPWVRLSVQFDEDYQSWLQNESAYCLTALGRLTEALVPMRASAKADVKAEKWKDAAVSHSNLSQLELKLGEVAAAVTDAEHAVRYADISGDVFDPVTKRAAHADALQHAGRETAAMECFREAERLQFKAQPYEYLYSLAGFQYCDLLVAASEQASWRKFLECSEVSTPLSGKLSSRSDWNNKVYFKSLDVVSRRARSTIKLEQEFRGAPIVDFALHLLILGRVTLYKEVLKKGLRHNAKTTNLKTMLDHAVNGLRQAGIMYHVPRGLLTRAWVRFLSSVDTGAGSAQQDLDEAWEIAERGPMRLHMADIHLYRARLFFREKEYPWESPEADIAAARRLIEQCGYWRRKEELEDAVGVILKKSV